MVYHHLKEK